MLSIIYQDAELVAINKPSGLLVHRSSIDKNETVFAVQTLRNQLNARVYPIHRLDKPTSGVLLFAFDSATVQRVSESWENVEKYYLAIVRGKLISQRLNHPIKTKSETSNSVKIQSAETWFSTLATTHIDKTFGRQSDLYHQTSLSLVQASLQTGRKHQIRKHLKHLNHPIIGDTCYGKGDVNRYFRKSHSTERLMLHCHYLRLNHPTTGEKITLHARLDSSWLLLLHELNWQLCGNVSSSDR